MPAASAVRASSARSSAVSPIAAIEILSSAATCLTLFRGSFDGSVVERAPQIEAGEGAVGPPFLREFLQLLRAGQVLHPVGDLYGPPDAEIADRDNVRPTEVEDQEHLGGPGADPVHLDELRDHVLVGELREPLQVE